MSDGIRNGQQHRLNGPQEIGAYVTKIGQKRRAALFIITGARSSTVEQRPRLPPGGGKIKTALTIFCSGYSASDLCIGDVEEAHCICISMCGTNERIQLAREFFAICPAHGIRCNSLFPVLSGKSLSLAPAIMDNLDEGEV